MSPVRARNKFTWALVIADRLPSAPPDWDLSNLSSAAVWTTELSGRLAGWATLTLLLRQPVDRWSAAQLLRSLQLGHQTGSQRARSSHRRLLARDLHLRLRAVCSWRARAGRFSRKSASARSAAPTHEGAAKASAQLTPTRKCLAGWRAVKMSKCRTLAGAQKPPERARLSREIGADRTQSDAQRLRGSEEREQAQRIHCDSWALIIQCNQ